MENNVLFLRHISCQRGEAQCLEAAAAANDSIGDFDAGSLASVARGLARVGRPGPAEASLGSNKLFNV